MDMDFVNFLVFISLYIIREKGDPDEIKEC